MKKRLSQIITVLLLVLSIGPALAVAMPAMLDYPDHLAWMYLLTRDGTDAANPFYQVSWTFDTNLAMELVVPPLAWWIGVAAAAKTFFLISQLLVIGGAMALERAVKGRLELAPLSAAIFLYSPPFAWGFVNFEFALGVALWAITAWLAMDGRPLFVRALVHSAFVIILFVGHLFALGIYGATLGLHELWRMRSGRASVRKTAIVMAVLAAPAIVLLGVLLILGHPVGDAASETAWRFDLKPVWVFLAINGYDYLLSCVGMVLLLAACCVLARRGHLKFTASGAWIAAGFALLYLAMPFRLLGTAYTDMRVLTAAALIVPSFVRLSLPNMAWRRTVFFTAAGYALANLAVVWWVWLSDGSDFAALIASFDRIAKGSAVLVADSNAPGQTGGSPPGGNPRDYPFYRAPNLAVAYANALVSSVYNYPRDRMLRSAYRQFAQPPRYLAPRIASLAAMAAGAYNNPPAYLRSWPDKYDYVYVVGPRTPNPMPLLLHELDAGSRFVLYRIDHAAKTNKADGG
ncbi:MAG: hypothetical protein WB760_09400 [Xanthobacteraceae bacterium]